MIRVLLKTILAVSISVTLFSCKNNQQEDTRPVIAVSILPQEYFVKQIAGDLFSINVLIPPGASPATYEPKPSQLAGLAKADLYLKIGYTGFEMAWMDKIAATNEKMKIVNLSDGINLIMEGNMQEHGDHKMTQQKEGLHSSENLTDSDIGELDNSHQNDEQQQDHHHGGIDPHTWLSPKNAVIIVENIYRALKTAYPAHQDDFKSNFESFRQSLIELDQQISDSLEDLKSRDFFTYHPSLSYFARDYNLDQHPLELAGKTPSSAHLKNLIDIGKELGIKVVFLQMQFDQKNAEVLAEEISAEIVQINPLDPKWRDQMLFIANKIKENLQ